MDSTVLGSHGGVLGTLRITQWVYLPDRGWRGDRPQAGSRVCCRDPGSRDIAAKESACCVAHERGRTQILHISANKIHNYEFWREQMERKCRVSQAHNTALPAHQGQPHCVPPEIFMDPDQGSQDGSNVVGRRRGDLTGQGARRPSRHAVGPTEKGQKTWCPVRCEDLTHRIPDARWSFCTLLMLQFNNPQMGTASK